MSKEDRPDFEEFKNRGHKFRITRTKDTGKWLVENKEGSTFYKDSSVKDTDTEFSDTLNFTISKELDRDTKNSINVCADNKKIEEYMGCMEPVTVYIMYLGDMYGAVDGSMRYGFGESYAAAVYGTPAISRLVKKYTEINKN